MTDATTLTEVLATTHDGPRGPVRLDTDAVAFGPTADALPWLAARGLERPVLVCDETTIALAPDGAPSVVLEHPKADDHTLAALQARLPAGHTLVAVGAGTLNDLAKAAAHAAGAPYAVLPTAASMNGYTSTIAALTVDGLKSTLPTRAPRWIHVDPAIVAAAPPEMAGAGFGDLLSKSTATADWAVSHVLTGEPFNDTPDRLVRAAFATAIAAAPGLPTGDPDAAAQLTEALLLSGFSMAVAGSSSPSSGGEHLLSHFWDMTADAAGRQPDLHGAQVAIATLVCAALHQLLRDRTPADARPADPAPLAGVFTGRQAAAVDREAAAVCATDRRALVRERWDDCLAAAGRYLIPVTTLRAHLRTAGAPTRLAQLRVTPAELRRAFLAARFIRARYTVLDLAADAGLLETLLEPALALSGVLQE